MFDLIIRRFLATFRDPAISEYTIVTILVKDDIFKADGNKMLYEGWMYFYKPYVSVAGTELIELHEGDILRNVAVTMDEKYTQPQPRFNQATLCHIKG